MNLILCCLIYSLLFMLYQCIPCWRNIVNTLDIICVELLLTIIDIFHCWGPVIHKACKPLNDLHTIFVWTEAVAWFWISYKHHCYFIKYLPCSPCFQLVFSTKGRNSVTSCEHTRKAVHHIFLLKQQLSYESGSNVCLCQRQIPHTVVLAQWKLNCQNKKWLWRQHPYLLVTTVITSWPWLIIDSMCFLVVTWGHLTFVKFRAIREGQVTSVYDKFFETFFRDQFLY